MPSPVRFVTLSLVILAALARGASTQELSGVVTLADGKSLAGAIVILTGARGEKLHGTLSADDGRYHLRAPGAGTYGLRVDLVGYRSTQVAPFELRANERVTRHLAVHLERVTLPSVAVTATTTCAVLAGDDGAAPRLWSEARKALEATRLAQDERRFPVTITRFERLLTLPDSSVQSSRSFTETGITRNPFVSLPPDSIERLGYRVRTGDRDVYYAPDARLLLSDEFVAAHCFSTRPGGSAGTTGLAFRPHRATSRTDVEGVLWLDATSAELRSLEFRFTPAPTRGAVAGGSVEFARLPSGFWGVSRWSVRIPVLEVRESTRRPDGALGRFVDTVVRAVHEEGGEALTAPGAGSSLASTRLGRLHGTVIDSTGPAPLAGAVVTLEEAGLTVHTDSQGRFQFDSLDQDGTFRVRFWHPRLDSLGVAMPRATVRLRRGGETIALLAVSGVETLARDRCGASPPAGSRIVTGIVRSGGAAAPYAEVVLLERAMDSSAANTGRRFMTRANESGRYAFCASGSRFAAWLVARAGGAWSGPVSVEGSSLAVALDPVAPMVGAGDSTARLVKPDSIPSIPSAAREIPESWQADFDARRRREQGVFFDRAAIDRLGATSLADVVRRVPGVRVVPGPSGPRFQSVRAGRLSFDPTLAQCDLAVFVDGQPVPGNEENGVSIAIAQVAAIEVYASATALPRVFSGVRSTCGVIALWHGRRR